MTTEYLDIVTRVKGAVQGATDLGQVEGAIDRIGTKAEGLKGKLGTLGGQIGGLIQSNQWLIRNEIGSQAGQLVNQSNAAEGPQGIAGNVLGSGVAGFATAGPVGALVGIAGGIAKSATEIGTAVSKQAGDVSKTGEDFLKHNPTIDELNTSIAGIDKGISDMMANPLTFFLGGGDAAKKLTDLKAEYEKQRDALVAADAKRSLDEARNAQSIVQAIHGIDVKPIVNVSLSSKTVETAQQQSDRYGGTYVPGGIRGF